MQQKSAGETISQQVVHQPRRFSRPFFLRMAASCAPPDAERLGASMRAGLRSVGASRAAAYHSAAAPAASELSGNGWTVSADKGIFC